MDVTGCGREIVIINHELINSWMILVDDCDDDDYDYVYDDDDEDDDDDDDKTEGMINCLII